MLQRLRVCLRVRVGQIERYKMTQSHYLLLNEENIKTERQILVDHLERTSLVDFGSTEALGRLDEAIAFANTLFEVDTSQVEPMTSVLDKAFLRLREDKVEVTNRKDILSNASVVEEDYFLSPPGNIPLSSNDKSY